MCEPQNHDNGASDLWTLTAYKLRGYLYVVKKFNNLHQITYEIVLGT